MKRFEKTLLLVLNGSSDANIHFSDVCYLLEKLGFTERVRGDHHIFSKSGIDEILNLQPKGSKAKPYQVKQIRNVVLRYKLGDILG
ncbi:MAG: type II toxin-antitoxin system HicA family toxin [Calditrichaeota bacterium]|nr:type II toxin-antitoxin system HicA family toxin [Calditrichota bacterium]